MAWDIKPNIPVYLQLIDHIKADIISGTYSPGDRLPSVRDLAVEAAVNPNTIQRALSELERDGLITTQRTNGKFITEDVSLVDKLKEVQAMNIIEDFFMKMHRIGYETESIYCLVEKYKDTTSNERKM